MEKHRVVIKDGAASFVYDDALADLVKEGPASVVRVSHVEPHPLKGGWVADMSPSDGPVIGANGEMVLTGETVWPDGPHAKGAWSALEPFALREEALEAERAWLRREKGL